MMSSPSRTRTILATSSHVEVGVTGNRSIVPAHLVDPDGGILLHPQRSLGPCARRLLAGEASPRLDLVAIDVTAVPQPDRVRAVVRMTGRIEACTAPRHCFLQQHLGLAPGDSMARFVPDLVSLEHRDDSGRRLSTHVTTAAYAAAVSDPLAAWDARWSTHLDTGHAAHLRRFVERRALLTPQHTVRALQTDSTGLTLRIYSPDGTRDHRVAFAAPARCGCQAIRAFHQLVAEAASS